MESQTALTPVILDSSVVLTYLLDEPGRLAAEAAIADRGRISSANLAEVIGRLVRDGTDPGIAADTKLALPLIIIDWMRVWPSGRRDGAPTRRFGLSLGDRACLALAKREGLPAMTADRVGRSAAPVVGVEVRLIR